MHDRQADPRAVLLDDRGLIKKHVESSLFIFRRTIMRLFLVRHGITTYNISELYTGQTDAPLTELGVR